MPACDPAKSPGTGPVSVTTLPIVISVGVTPVSDALLSAALKETVYPEEQLPELLFSLSDLYHKSGDAAPERDARDRAVAAINALSAKPVARDAKKN